MTAIIQIDDQYEINDEDLEEYSFDSNSCIDNLFFEKNKLDKEYPNIMEKLEELLKNADGSFDAYYNMLNYTSYLEKYYDEITYVPLYISFNWLNDNFFGNIFKKIFDMVDKIKTMNYSNGFAKAKQYYEKYIKKFENVHITNRIINIMNVVDESIEQFKKDVMCNLDERVTIAFLEIICYDKQHFYKKQEALNSKNVVELKKYFDSLISRKYLLETIKEVIINSKFPYNMKSLKKIIDSKILNYIEQNNSFVKIWTITSNGYIDSDYVKLNEISDIFINFVFDDNEFIDLFNIVSTEYQVFSV